MTVAAGFTNPVHTVQANTRVKSERSPAAPLNHFLRTRFIAAQPGGVTSGDAGLARVIRQVGHEACANYREVLVM